jgi:hypothetical protein
MFYLERITTYRIKMDIWNLRALKELFSTFGKPFTVFFSTTATFWHKNILTFQALRKRTNIYRKLRLIVGTMYFIEVIQDAIVTWITCRFICIPVFLLFSTLWLYARYLECRNVWCLVSQLLCRFKSPSIWVSMFEVIWLQNTHTLWNS